MNDYEERYIIDIKPDCLINAFKSRRTVSQRPLYCTVITVSGAGPAVPSYHTPMMLPSLTAEGR